MKDVVGYEKRYKVTRDGKVFSLISDRYLSTFLSEKGYETLTLSKKGIARKKRVARLVAEAFIPNPNKYKEVNHINCIKTDNRVENLEWCTRSQNVLHAYKNGLYKNKGIGVYLYKRTNKFYACIERKGKTIYGKYFDTKQEGIEAREKFLAKWELENQ